VAGSRGKYGFREIYPRYRADEIQEVFIEPIPVQLHQLNISVRYAGLYLPKRTPWILDPGWRWKISLEALAYNPGPAPVPLQSSVQFL
jgi:hypothetical protein